MPRNEMKPFLCQGNEPDGGCLNIEMKSNVLVPRLGVNSKLELGPGGAAGDIALSQCHTQYMSHIACTSNITILILKMERSPWNKIKETTGMG